GETHPEHKTKKALFYSDPGVLALHADLRLCLVHQEIRDGRSHCGPQAPTQRVLAENVDKTNIDASGDSLLNVLRIPQGLEPLETSLSTPDAAGHQGGN